MFQGHELVLTALLSHSACVSLWNAEVAALKWHGPHSPIRGIPAEKIVPWARCPTVRLGKKKWWSSSGLVIFRVQWVWSWRPNAVLCTERWLLWRQWLDWLFNGQASPVMVLGASWTLNGTYYGILSKASSFFMFLITVEVQSVLLPFFFFSGHHSWRSRQEFSPPVFPWISVST